MRVPFPVALRSAALLAVLTAVPTVPLSAQGGVVTLRVRSDAGGEPLVNAEVIDTGSGRRAFTQANGVAVLRLPRRERVTVRVRQLGHAFTELELRPTAWPAATDTLEVRLARVAYRLPSVTTRSVLACEQLADGQSALAFDALDQLREGAERYGHFRRTYRFRVELERRTSREYPGDEQARTDRRVEQANGESWGAPYRPGAVVERGGPGTFSTPILFVHALGDPRFWRHHCITTVERAQDAQWGPVVRLGFEPTRDVRWTDWRGVATLDSASWVLRRLDFALDVRQRDGPRRLEGFTTFREVSPLIAMPDSTGAVWWYRAPGDEPPRDRTSRHPRAAMDSPSGEDPWGPPHLVQVLRQLSLTWRDSTPPRP